MNLLKASKLKNIFVLPLKALTCYPKKSEWRECGD